MAADDIPGGSRAIVDTLTERGSIALGLSQGKRARLRQGSQSQSERQELESSLQ